MVLVQLVLSKKTFLDNFRMWNSFIGTRPVKLALRYGKIDGQNFFNRIAAPHLQNNISEIESLLCRQLTHFCPKNSLFTNKFG